MESVENHSFAMFKWRSGIRAGFVGIGILLLLLLSGGVMLKWGQAGYNEAFRFISLLVLFMAALAITAAIFSGLQLGDRGEAFGLPSGSVRALLAVGILILFVVFGLPLTSPTPSDNTNAIEQKPLALVEVPYDKLSEATSSYIAQKFSVIVEDYGAPSTVSPGATGSVTHPAKIRLLPPDRFSERLEVSKQLVTAIMTLMTSIISFYFGSRSVTDAIKPDPKAEGSSADLSLRRKELSGGLDSLKAKLSDRGKQVDEIATLPDPTDPQELADRKDAADAVISRRKTFDDKLATIAQTLATVDQALANLQSAMPADARAVNDRQANEGLASIADGLTALEALLPAYDNEIATYQNASAVG